APDGARLVGKAACLANWQDLAKSTATWFIREEVLVVGERAIVRWRHCWGEDDGQSIRGVNLMRVRDGLIVEAMGYVKGWKRPRCISRYPNGKRASPCRPPISGRRVSGTSRRWHTAACRSSCSPRAGRITRP